MTRFCAYLYVLLVFFIPCGLLVFFIPCGFGQGLTSSEQVRGELQRHQYDLSGSGRAFLSEEARKVSFFLLGELHGENEIPTLLRQLWPGMWQGGYRYIAAEVSPWAANQLEFSRAGQSKVVALWSKEEALFVHSQGASQAVLWGCDMDEFQPELLIRDLSRANPSNVILGRMLGVTKAGYERKMAPELLDLAHELTNIRDLAVDDASLVGNLRSTLEIESNRLKPETKFSAQVGRESLMKELFLLHYREHIGSNSKAKVLARFGRNHLHRGYDARGISTLGNLISEFAFSEHKTVFNVAAFGAGGKASFAGETWDADERGDDLAFDFLASLARYPATVFDLRPIRPILHGIPEDKRNPVEQRLIYWADSYDAILCYKNVSPLQSN